MADKTPEAIPAIKPLTGQEAPPPAPTAPSRQGIQARDVAPLPRRDTVQISDAARKASHGNLRFDYNPDTNTLQAQMVDANGKTLSEIPTDVQIKARQRLAEFLSQETGTGDGQG